MKKHELYKELEILDETEKAVKIANLERTDNMEKNYKLIWENGINVWFNDKPFWLPKSQIEIKDNKVVAITKWMFNQLLMFIDCPVILKEDMKEIKRQSCIGDSIDKMTEIKNKELKGEKRW